MLAAIPSIPLAAEEPVAPDVQAPAASDESEPAPAEPRRLSPAEEAAAWTPAIPSDGADWIMLVSGEWLRGQLHRYRDDVVEFESDELDDQEFDYADVKAFRVGRSRQFVLVDRSEHIGPAVMRDGTITVYTASGPVSFARSQLLGIVPAAENRWDLWDGKISIGVSATSGNTNEQNFSGYGYLRRSAAFTRLRFDYNGTISFVNDEENANNHRGTAKFDVFLSRRWYFTPAMLDVFSDKFQNIAMRITPSMAIGYHIYNQPKIEWDVELGAGAQLTRLDSVAVDPSTMTPLEDREMLSGALIGGTRVDWDVTKRIDWTLDFRYQVAVPDVDQRFTNLFSTLSFEVTKILDIDLSIKFNRVANPSPSGFDTTTVPPTAIFPKENDVTFTFGFGLEF